MSKLDWHKSQGRDEWIAVIGDLPMFVRNDKYSFNWEVVKDEEFLAKGWTDALAKAKKFAEAVVRVEIADG